MEQKVITTVQDTASMIWSYVPNLVGALAILVIGWIVAGWLARLVRVGLEKSGLVGRLSKVVSDVDVEDAKTVELWIGKSVFVILILFVLVGFFQVLGLNQITQPITGFLNEIFLYLPRLIGPVVLVLVAWIVAKFLRIVVRRGMASTKLDERVQKDADYTDDKKMSLSNTAGEAVYWLTFLVFLPAILGSLELGGLLGPVRGLVDTLLGYLPNLFAAGLILFIGWLVAKVVRKILTNLLAAAGTDRLSEKVGLHSALGKQNLSGLTGLIAYVLILIPVIVGALNALNLAAITQPASQMLNEILAVIPNLFAGSLVLVVAYVVAKIVAGLTTGLLAGVGFDSLPHRLGLQADEKSKGRSASEIAGFILIVAIMLFATIEAFRLIGFETAGALISEFLIFSGHVLLGLLIIGLGLFLAKFVADIIKDTGLPNASLLALIARVAILVLASAMGLGEMGLGEDIIVLAFGLTLGAVAVALAIAFGLGGRDAAAQITAKWSDGTASGGSKPSKD
jgi:hypothetical protein